MAEFNPNSTLFKRPWEPSAKVQEPPPLLRLPSPQTTSPSNPAQGGKVLAPRPVPRGAAPVQEPRPVQGPYAPPRPAAPAQAPFPMPAAPAWVQKSPTVQGPQVPGVTSQQPSVPSWVQLPPPPPVQGPQLPSVTPTGVTPAPPWQGPLPNADYYRGMAEGAIATGAQAAAVSATINQGKPAGGATVAPPEKMFDLTDERRDLTSYSYELSPDEARLLGLAKASGAPAPAVQQQAGSSNYLMNQPMPTVKAAAMPTVTRDEYVAAPLTEAGYQALSADQKAAVDFNTLLVEARERDLGQEWNLTPEERKEYDRRVNEIFGPQGGSQTVAPTVVSLLNSIDFKAVGQDLDEYLSLERAITADKLKDFTLGDSELKLLEGGTKYADVRTPENLSAVEDTAVAQSKAFIEKAMQDANTVLWDFESTMGNTLSWMDVDTSAAPLGYGLPGTRTDENSALMDQWLQGSYSALASGKASLEDVFADMEANKFTDEDKQGFFNYVDRRTKLQSQYGAPAEEGVVLGVEDIRKLVGLK